MLGSVTLPYRGEGYSDDGAKISAIRNINPADERIRFFISKAKERIVEYYSENLNTLLSKARMLTATQQYGEALMLLRTYPESLSGYNKVAEEIIKVFNEYQRKNCSETLQKARSAFALGNYEEAASLITEIDMPSPCATDAKRLASEIRSSVNAEQNAAMELYKYEQSTAADLEKRRIEAVENIAQAYLQSRTDYVYVLY